MKPNIRERLQANELVAAEDKEAVYKFLDVAQQVEFGKISSRQEGYLFKELKLPRCTSVLQMDGGKAGALMEWAKRQVSNRIEKLLLEELKKGGKLNENLIANICLEGLVDPDKQRDEAAEVGTGVHDIIENWLTGYFDGKLDNAPEPLLRFISAWNATGYTVIGTEIPIIWYDEAGKGFGGRLDILAYKDRRFYIGDNKTSRSVHESYGLQISAYKKAVEQMSKGAIKIDGGYIFHIPTLETLNDRQKKEYDKRGSLIQLKDLDNAFEHYRLLLELYYRRNSKYF